MKCTGEGNCGGFPCDSAARDGINEPICCDVCEEELAPIFEGQEKHKTCHSCMNK